jgi:hypothetical protein
MLMEKCKIQILFTRSLPFRLDLGHILLIRRTLGVFELKMR